MIVLIGLIVMFSLLLVDLVTKMLAAVTNVNVSFWIVGLKYTKNSGIAYGLLGNNAVAMNIVTILTIVMIVLIAVMFFTVFKRNKAAQICVAVIEAGAIGNLIDRLVLSYVRDFVDVSAFGFGVCNIADFCITFGAVALVFVIVFIGKNAIFPLKKKWRKQAAEERARDEGAPTRKDENLKDDE